jgi:phosphatidylserine/phosphatidylglycerophosphate/cardiolipin synthase-like enzyme
MFKKKILVRPPPPPQKPPRRRFPWVLFAAALFSTWFVWESLVPNLPRAGESPRLYSNQCQQDIRATLLNAIRQASSSVHLVMFGLSDRAILTALKEKIQKNIPTTIYYDTGGSPKLFKFLQGANVHPVKNTGLMHQKIVVLDNSMVFVGSANMTTPSLKMHDNLVLGFVSPSVARFLQSHKPFSPGYFQTKVGKQELELWLLPDPRGHALASLRKKIRNAKRTIKIALFTFTHQGLVDELLEARTRGVNVSIVIDMHSGMGASSRTVERLEKGGISVLLSQGMQLLHHKFIYIDDQMLVMGSANWTKAAFYKNSDCILSLNHLNSEQKRFMTNLWRKIETKTKNLPQ